MSEYGASRSGGPGSPVDDPEQPYEQFIAAISAFAAALQGMVAHLQAREVSPPQLSGRPLSSPPDELLVELLRQALEDKEQAVRVGDLAVRLASCGLAVTPMRVRRVLEEAGEFETRGQGWWRSCRRPRAAQPDPAETDDSYLTELLRTGG